MHIIHIVLVSHDEYNSSNKDKPLNIKSKSIQDLYDGLFRFHFSQYQMPIRGRWGYELRTAIAYISDWHLFRDWLAFDWIIT